jgi:hypothetical protein
MPRGTGAGYDIPVEDFERDWNQRSEDILERSLSKVESNLIWEVFVMEREGVVAGLTAKYANETKKFNQMARRVKRVEAKLSVALETAESRYKKENKTFFDRVLERLKAVLKRS